MRVLRVIARLNVGGPAIQAVALTRHLSAQGIKTRLVCGYVGPNEGDMAYLAREQGVDPHYLKELGREILLFSDLRALAALIRVVSGFRPGIIHTHTAKAGTLGRLAGILWNAFHRKGDRVRLVHTFHGHVFHSYFGRTKTAVFVCIERFLAWFTDRIVVISPAQKRDICHRYRIAPPWKVTVVPLGFDLTSFTEERGDEDRRTGRLELPGKDYGEDCFVVGFVGRLAPVKNPQMLLSAVKRIEEQGRGAGFRFVLVGDGELRMDLERKVQELGVRDRVYFAGWRRRMEPVYAALDAVVLTSLNEGTPVTLIEAMAAGRPVVATAVGGVPDLMGKVEADLGKGVKRAERGLLIPSGDDLALAHALAFLRDHGTELSQMKQRAARYALSAYSLERLVKDLKGLYRDLS